MEIRDGPLPAKATPISLGHHRPSEIWLYVFDHLPVGLAHCRVPRDELVDDRDHGRVAPRFGFLETNEHVLRHDAPRQEGLQLVAVGACLVPCVECVEKRPWLELAGDPKLELGAALMDVHSADCTRSIGHDNPPVSSTATISSSRRALLSRLEP